MKKLGLRKRMDFPEDANTIKDFVENKGFEIGLVETHELWEQFSDEWYCAGFMVVDEDTLNKFAEWLDD